MRYHSRMNRILVLAVCCAVFIACSPPEATEEVPIKSLWHSRREYLGRRVSVDGTLKLFLKGKPKEHYAVESDDVYRVGVSGVERSELDALLDAKVRAVGVFRFDEKRGGYLENAALTGL